MNSCVVIPRVVVTDIIPLTSFAVVIRNVIILLRCIIVLLRYIIVLLRYIIVIRSKVKGSYGPPSPPRLLLL